MKRMLSAGRWLLSVGLILWASCQQGHAASSDAGSRPNFLWLIAEDLGPHLGCFGTKEVSTPNLDRLAADGVLYVRCFNGHVCSPSRSAFMTGMYATAIGANNHRTEDKKPLPTGVRLLTDWMHDAGYFTANIVQLPPSLGFYGTGKTDWNFTHKKKPFDSSNWADLKTNQPFFAQVNFYETHRPYHAARRADPAKVDIPPYYPDHEVTRADWAAYLDSVTVLDRKVGLVLEQLERDGLASNTVVLFFGDNGQSHVRGKQFCYEEGLWVPAILRWPANIAPPVGYSPGTKDRRLIEGIDFGATMLSLAGANKPSSMQGRVFLGAGREPDRKYVFGARDRCDETVMCLRTVRDERYRYIRNYMPEVPFLATNAYKERSYPVWNLLKQQHAAGKLTPAQEVLCRPSMPAEELYDLMADPWETNNLASAQDPATEAKLQCLREALDKWMTACHDPGPAPDAPTAAVRPNGKASK